MLGVFFFKRNREQRIETLKQANQLRLGLEGFLRAPYPLP